MGRERFKQFKEKKVRSFKSDSNGDDKLSEDFQIGAQTPVAKRKLIHFLSKSINMKKKAARENEGGRQIYPLKKKLREGGREEEAEREREASGIDIQGLEQAPKHFKHQT